MDHITFILALLLLLVLSCFNIAYFFPYWMGRNVDRVDIECPMYFYFEIPPFLLTQIDQLHKAIDFINIGPNMELSLAVLPEKQKLINAALCQPLDDTRYNIIKEIRVQFSKIVLKMEKYTPGDIISEAAARHDIVLTWKITDDRSFGLFQNRAGDVTYRLFEVLPLGDAHG